MNHTAHLRVRFFAIKVQLRNFLFQQQFLCIFRTIASEYKNECGFDDSTLTFYWDLFSNLLTLLTLKLSKYPRMVMVSGIVQD